MHFLQRITVRAATDQNICVIFFVTVSRYFKFLKNCLNKGIYTLLGPAKMWPIKVRVLKTI